MDRVLKSLTVTLLVLIAVPLTVFVAYDKVVFQPRLPAIRGLLAQADAEDRKPPIRIQRFIAKMHESGGSPSTSVSRSLLLKVHPRPTRGFPGWHPRYALWHALVSLHLSDTEIMGLYSSLAYNGVDHGLNKLSLRVFHKPLSTLSDREAATVVAMTWAPGFYSRRPDLLAARRDKLLTGMQNGP